MQQQAPEFVKAMPSFPACMRSMRSMCNKAIHSYFESDLRTVWTIAKNDLPTLEQQIGRLLIDLKHEPGAEHKNPIRVGNAMAVNSDSWTLVHSA